MTTGEDQARIAEVGQLEPHPRRRLIFAIVSVALFLIAANQTMVATALTAIQRDLDAPVNWSGWTITAYALGQIVTMPLAGKISDMYGRKRVFLIAVAVFTTASLSCALAGNIYLLVALRALQALGGGAFVPSASGIIADHFGRERDRALGMFTSILPIGGIVGPVVGGVFVTYLSWRAAFLLHVPLGILLIALGWRFIPRSSTLAGAKLDIRGVVLLAVTIMAAMLGVTFLGNSGSGVTHPSFLLAAAVAITTAFLFIRHTRRQAAPFIPLRLLRGKGFGVMNLINLLYGSAAIGFGALVPLYAAQRFGVSPLEAGTLLTARAVGMICVAGLAALALRRTGYRVPMVVGFLIVAAGMTMMSLPPAGMSPQVWLAIAAGATGIGMGMSVPAANNASMQLDPDQIAAIVGLRGMFRQSGAILGISITTAILAVSATPGITQAHVFLVFAGLLLCVVPFIRFVPEHRGSW